MQMKALRIEKIIMGIMLMLSSLLLAANDMSAVLSGRAFRMWINDDADRSDGESSPVDIPGQADPDCADYVVNGRRDLVDFFPIWLNISSFAPWLSDGSIGVGLIHKDSAVNIVWTSLGNLEAGRFLQEDIGGCGPDLDQDAHVAETVRVTADGIAVPEKVITMILKDSSKGVVMAEGVAASSKPLVIVMFDKSTRKVLFAFPLSMRISPVVDMIRWANIRATAGGVADRTTDMVEPVGLPDAETNGKHLVFVHGYSVSEGKALGWGVEMFKRFRQSGCNCAFTAVAWHGDDSRKWWYLDNTPNYYVNVEHAFQSAAALKNVMHGLSGEKVVVAHSLGNMLVSSAIADHGLSVSSYFMLNAAVPVEAYVPEEITDESSYNMANPDWHGYANRLWASHWHEVWKRFDPIDGRANLTWRGRFASINNAHNYYSSDDEVLRNGNGEAQSLFSGDFAWYNQESRKGQWPMLLPGNNEAGWSFNGAYDTLLSHMDPVEAAELRDDTIRTNSFFGLFDERGLYGTNGSALAVQPNLRARVLADGIPAESYAAGANAIDPDGKWAGRNVNMPDVVKGVQGNVYDEVREESWRHSDIKKRPYQHVRDVFLSMIDKGNLR